MCQQLTFGELTSRNVEHELNAGLAPLSTATCASAAPAPPAISEADESAASHVSSRGTEDMVIVLSCGRHPKCLPPHTLPHSLLNCLRKQLLMVLVLLLWL
jgi:hypothetical protein